jgi:preprotein translocase subunit SecG
MITLVTIVHLFTALMLILFVMLQDPKGGGAFGIGGSAATQSIFGNTGAANFLTITTKWLAIVFAVTSIGLSFLSRDQGKSAMEGYVAPKTTTESQTTNGTPGDGSQNAEPNKAAPDKNAN